MVFLNSGVYMFNPKVNGWRRIYVNELSQLQIVYHCTANVDGKIYILGGSFDPSASYESRSANETIRRGKRLKQILFIVSAKLNKIAALLTRKRLEITCKTISKVEKKFPTPIFMEKFFFNFVCYKFSLQKLSAESI